MKHRKDICFIGTGMMKRETRANKRIKSGICLHLLAVLVATVFFMTGVSTAFANTAEYEDYSDLAGKRISMLTGAPFEELVRSKVPDVGDFSYYNSMPDMILALKNNKTDAILMNNAVADLALNRNQDLAYSFLKGSVEDLSFHYDEQAYYPNVVKVIIRE